MVSKQSSGLALFFPLPRVIQSSPSTLCSCQFCLVWLERKFDKSVLHKTMDICDV